VAANVSRPVPRGSPLAKVLKAVRAEQDLDDIWFYIATDNIGAADQLLDAFARHADQLCTQPLMGRARPELAPGIRSSPLGRYVVFYRPVSAGIEIVRVLHSARDIFALAAQGGFGGG
jgi:toxin ParE1/3/4